MAITIRSRYVAEVFHLEDSLLSDEDVTNALNNGLEVFTMLVAQELDFLQEAKLAAIIQLCLEGK